MALGPQRLARAGDDGASPHDRVQRWLQETADLTSDAASDPESSERRVVPRLRPHALADQVVVLTSDAVRVMSARADGSGPTDLARRLVALRRSL